MAVARKLAPARRASRTRGGKGVRANVAPGRGVPPRVQVSEMQRARLLSAAVLVIDELGLAGASVAHISARARVSRRTFYELFANREECVIAVLDDVLARITSDLDMASLDGLVWRERVRTGLWRVLCFLDREPVLARVCVVQSARGGRRVLERREEILTQLAGVIDQGRSESARAAQTPVLTAEGLVGAAIAIVYSRLLRGESDPLSSLVGELMGLIVLPYLGPAAARREQTRALPSITDTGGSSSVWRSVGGSREEMLRDLPMRLTYRTARVLEVLAECPGASNRFVAEHAEVSDQGQISKLLARLERIGLLQNTGRGHAKGEANVWSLTPAGHQVTQSIASPHTTPTNTNPSTAVPSKSVTVMSRKGITR